MATRLSFENSSEVGVFSALTNSYCLAGTFLWLVCNAFHHVPFKFRSTNGILSDWIDDGSSCLWVLLVGWLELHWVHSLEERTSPTHPTLIFPPLFLIVIHHFDSYRYILTCLVVFCLLVSRILGRCGRFGKFLW
jgi:hypothetical protein